MEFTEYIAEALQTNAAVRVGLLGLEWPGTLPPPEELTTLVVSDDDGPGEPPRVDLAIVYLRPAIPGGNEPLSPGQRALLGTLRDRVAPRVLGAVEIADAVTPALSDQLRALGFDDRGRARHAGGTVQVMGFDIDAYKRTPDWLSPRDWANPELWNRYRW